jgi:hypothetical protein
MRSMVPDNVTAALELLRLTLQLLTFPITQHIRVWFAPVLRCVVRLFATVFTAPSTPGVRLVNRIVQQSTLFVGNTHSLLVFLGCNGRTVLPDLYGGKGSAGQQQRVVC